MFPEVEEFEAKELDSIKQIRAIRDYKPTPEEFRAALIKLVELHNQLMSMS